MALNTPFFKNRVGFTRIFGDKQAEVKARVAIN
jgi:hypothetical protein